MSEKKECQTCYGDGFVDCDAECQECNLPCGGEMDCRDCDGEGFMEVVK